MKIKNIMIRVHPAVIFASIFFVFMGMSEIFFITLFFVTIHEMAHITTALFFQGKISEIFITPLGERCTIKNINSLSSIAKMLIIFSGPFVSILLGFILYYFFPKGGVMEFCSFINFSIGIFNLLPVLPLDGGAFLLVFFGRKKGVIYVGRKICILTKIIGIFITALGVIQFAIYPFNISLFILGVFLWKKSKIEYMFLISNFYSTIFNEKRIYGENPVEIRYIMSRKGENMRRVIEKWNTEDYFITCWYEGDTLKYINQKEAVKRMLNESEFLI